MNARWEMRAGSVVSYVNTILNIALGLALTPFLIRTLGDEQYGLYQLVGPFVGYLAVLDFGLGNSIIRYVAKYRAEGDAAGERKILGMCLRIYGIITLLLAGICWAGYAHLQDIFGRTLSAAELEALRRMFVLLGANWAVNMLQNTFAAAIQAYRRFVFHRVVILSRLALRAALLVILLSGGGSALTVVWIDTILNLAQYAVYIAYAVFVLRLRFDFGPVDRALFREVFSFSFFVFLNALMDQIYWRLDSSLLAIVKYPGMKNTMMVAVNAAGTQLIMCFMQFSTAISGVLLPHATEMVVKGCSADGLTGFMIRVGRIQAAILGLMMVGYFSIGRQFVLQWLGAEYEASYAVAGIAICALFIPLIQNSGISILQAMNRHAFRSVMLLFAALLNVPLSVFLIRLYGAPGATLGTGLALIAGNVVGINIYYAKVIGIDLARFFRETARGILPAMAVSYLAALALSRLPVSGWAGLILKGASITLVYGALLWTIGLNGGERAAARGALERLFRNERMR